MSTSRSKLRHPLLLEARQLGIFLTLAAPLSAYIWSQSFSPRLVAIFGLWALAALALLAALPLRDDPEVNDRTRRLSSWIIAVAGSLLTISTIAGLMQWTKEADGGTLAIYVAPGARSIPQEIKISRGFPRWLGFLDKPQVVKLDKLNRKFSAPRLRCGRWYISPQPASEYRQIGPAEIPTDEPRKFTMTSAFQRHRCKLILKTLDADGNNIEGAVIQLKPKPPDLQRKARTPEVIELEVGNYEIAFSLQGYKTSETLQRQCFPDMEEEVSAVLIAETGETQAHQAQHTPPTIQNAQPPTQARQRSLVPNSDSPTNETRTQEPTDRNEEKESQASEPTLRRATPGLPLPRNEPDEEALAALRKEELNNLSRRIKNLDSAGETDRAKRELRLFIEKYPGTPESDDAEELINQLTGGK